MGDVSYHKEFVHRDKGTPTARSVRKAENLGSGSEIVSPP